MKNNTEKSEKSVHQLCEETVRNCEKAIQNCKKANTMSNIAIACGVLSILINVLAGIDKIENFAQYLLSYLH